MSWIGMFLNGLLLTGLHFCRIFSDRLKKSALRDNSGMGVIEVILIIVVLISLVLIFKTQLTGLVKTIFGNIKDSALEI